MHFGVLGRRLFAIAKSYPIQRSMVQSVTHTPPWLYHIQKDGEIRSRFAFETHIQEMGGWLQNGLVLAGYVATETESC